MPNSLDQVTSENKLRTVKVEIAQRLGLKLLLNSPKPQSNDKRYSQPALQSIPRIDEEAAENTNTTFIEMPQAWEDRNKTNLDDLRSRNSKQQTSIVFGKSPAANFNPQDPEKQSYCWITPIRQRKVASTSCILKGEDKLETAKKVDLRTQPATPKMADRHRTPRIACNLSLRSNSRTRSSEKPKISSNLQLRCFLSRAPPKQN